jgi:hypothetical protein
MLKKTFRFCNLKIEQKVSCFILNFCTALDEISCELSTWFSWQLV